jgi:hypothetical protein
MSELAETASFAVNVRGHKYVVILFRVRKWARYEILYRGRKVASGAATGWDLEKARQEAIQHVYRLSA